MVFSTTIQSLFGETRFYNFLFVCCTCENIVLIQNLAFLQFLHNLVAIFFEFFELFHVFCRCVNNLYCFSVCSSIDCFIVLFSTKLSESRNCGFAQILKHTLRVCPLALAIRTISGLIQTLSAAVCVCLCLPLSASVCVFAPKLTF